jgi:Uma2 family endonuclease
MTVATARKMSLEEYLTYDDGTDIRYELVDGVLVEMGAENPLNPMIAAFLMFLFADLGIPRENLVIGHQVGVSSSRATARQPDLIVHTDESRAAILDDGKILRAGRSAPMLVIEVVSNSIKDKKSRDRDYEEKPVEYAEREIPEYWLIDPDRAWVKVGTLTNGAYKFRSFKGKQVVVSPTLPNLKLTVEQVLRARL